MKIFQGFLLIIAVFLISSCGSNKQNQSNLGNVSDEESQFARTLYGEGALVIIKGDLLASGKTSAIAGIVKQKTDNSFWIQKASFIQKETDGWKVVMKMEDKLSNSKGELISQVDSKNGYIISFDSSKKPIEINIVMANEYGKSNSDDALLKWNKEKDTFEFSAPLENNAQ
ncbi:MAG: hypothetical protein K8I03_09125 [Ignavibacteria bacterium]|nr:hypothetical protein [Ignavibacteria bacterium]